jgi:hypothetical protein
MQLNTDDECVAYVETQVQRLVQTDSRLHRARSPDVPTRQLSWELGRDPAGSGWYTLEARMGQREFLIWFGNHQMGAEGIHWIMRPAVHIAFDDLSPRGDSVGIHYSLSDVLAWMFGSLDARPGLAFRFAMNTFSLT